MSLRPSTPTTAPKPAETRDLTSFPSFVSRVLRIQPDNPVAQAAAGEIERVTGLASPSPKTSQQSTFSPAVLPTPTAPAPFVPPPPAPTLAPLNQTPAATLPALQGTANAPAVGGMPPWMTLLQQMPQFGGPAAMNPFGGPQGMPFQSPFGDNNPEQRRNPLSLTGADPRATDMRQLLLRQLMGGGMMS